MRLHGDRDPEVEGQPAEERRRRNTALGFVVVGVAGVLASASFLLAGSGPTAVALLSGLLATAVYWAMWKVGVPSQPGGHFLAIAAACAAALFAPLFAGVLREAQIRMQIPGVGAMKGGPNATAVAAQNVAPPPAALRAFTDAFKLSPPAAGAPNMVEVLRDTRVSVEGEEYIIRKGERFELQRSGADEVVFKAGDLLLSLPSRVVKVERAAEKAAAAPAPTPSPGAKPGPATGTDAAGGNADPSSQAMAAGDQTRRAQTEAVKRYPAIGIRDSRENKSYLDAFNDLKRTNPAFFDDPEWPLQLAEALAERDGWKREDR